MPMTPDQAKALLGVLTSYWPKADLPRETLVLYRDHLLDFDLEPAAQAVATLGATSRFWPTVAELRQAIIAAADPDPLPDPDQAWREVAIAARDGIYGRPVWSHRAVAETVQAMGGIRELAVSENQMADRAHFLRLYETCKARADRLKQLPSDRHVAELLAALGARHELPELESGKQ